MMVFVDWEQRDDCSIFGSQVQCQANKQQIQLERSQMMQFRLQIQTLQFYLQLMTQRKDLEAYPETNLSNQLLLHHQEMLKFLFYTNYDIVYETFQLKHGSYSERNRGHISQTFKSEQIAKHYQSSSQKNHIRILRDDIELDKQLSKLQILWHNRNIPYFHRYYFLKYLLTCYFKNIQPALIKEEQLIRSQEHVYYPTFKSINAREACLRNLRKQLAEMSAQDVYEYLHIAKERMFNEKRKIQREKYKSQGYKIKMTEETHEGKMAKTKFQLFSDTFNHLTKLTLYAVELILKWKDYIGTVSHDARKAKERMEYYFFDDNYFLKILNDLGFLKVSFLQQFYQFSPKNDPFLLHCVLAFEKKIQKTVQHQLLKQIFMPQKEHLAEITNKLQVLSEQYRSNIRSRKLYDINVLKQPLLRVQQKLLNNEANQNISNLVLKKIQSPLMAKKSKSLATFRVKVSAQKKEKIIVEFKQSSIKKKLLNIPGTIEKTIIQNDKNSPLKNTFIMQKNQNSVNLNTVDQNLLNMLKKEVIKKIRQQFYLNKGTKPHQNQALEILIDNKVEETMKNIFPFQPQKHLKQNVQFFPLSIKETRLAVEIDLMLKHSYSEYKQMQISQVDLMKTLEQAKYVYILVARIGEQEIGRVLCSLQKEVTDFKVLKVLYLHFIDLSQIQLLIVKFVEFLWQYENSFEVHYVFYQPANNEPIRLLIEGMQKTLQKQCLFGRKQVYSTVTEVKLVFKRKNKNINYFPNKNPFSFNLDFNLLFSNKKLMLQNKNEHKHLQLLNYDYFLMQALKKFITSQQILTLKEKVVWKSRLKLLVQMIKEEEENDLMLDQMVHIEAQNISQLNNKLTKLHRPFLQVSDIVKSNRVSLLSLKLILTPKYPIKSVHHTNHQQYYRLSIMNKFVIEIDQAGTEFIHLKTKESQNYQLVIFDAKEYLKVSKESELTLNQYLTERLAKRQHGIRRLEINMGALWVPMVRHPHKYKDREEMFFPTVRVLDLAYLKYDVLLGQKMEWLCNMQMDNSIIFQQHPEDKVINLPFGVAVAANSSKTVVYSRIII